MFYIDGNYIHKHLNSLTAYMDYYIIRSASGECEALKKKSYFGAICLTWFS